MGLHSAESQDTALLVHVGSDFRSDGPLSERALEEAHRAHTELSFDPVQNGWVRADATDDFDPQHSRPGWRNADRNGALSFRPWAQSDAATFRTLLNNPNVWTFLPTGYPGDITLDTVQDLIALAQDEALHRVRAICVDGLPVGQVRLEFREHESELSYWLGEAHWRKGIGGNAVSRFVAESFAADPDLDQIMARVKPGNAGSLKILENAGFVCDVKTDPTSEWIILRCNRPA